MICNLIEIYNPFSNQTLTAEYIEQVQLFFQKMSRLDRLFTLLASSSKGSGSALLAANQLGEVQKANNNLKQLEQLLERLHPLLR